MLASNGSAAEWVVPLSAYPCDLRLTLTSGTPVTTSDVTAATTLYFTPFRGNRLALYSGTAWVGFSQAELSIAVPATTSQVYDVFVDYNSGTPQLSLTAWTNDTTRATALTTQDGVYVKTGATGSRYVGSFRTTGVSGQTEDSATKRYVWNYYNRVRRLMLKTDTTANWAYSSATFQQANASAANQLDYVMGVQEDVVAAQVTSAARNSTGSVTIKVGIGLGSTTVNSATTFGGHTVVAANTITPLFANYIGFPGVGRRTLVWIEAGDGTATTTFFSNSGSALAGISGEVLG